MIDLDLEGKREICLLLTNTMLQNDDPFFYCERTILKFLYRDVSIVEILRNFGLLVFTELVQQVHPLDILIYLFKSILKHRSDGLQTGVMFDYFLLFLLFDFWQLKQVVVYFELIF